MTDVLLDASDLPFGAPRFDRIAAAMFPPTFRVAIDEAAREIAAIAGNPAPPDFANTILALERGGARLARVRRIFWTLSSAQSDDAIRAVEADVSAMLVQHGTAISHNAALFSRVRTVWEGRQTAGLDEPAQRLIEASYRGFVEGGALLDEAGKARFAAISTALADLSIRFGQNVMASVADWQMLLEAADLEGLPEPVRASASRRAEARGYAGKYLLTLDRGDAEAVLTFSARRDLRERMWRAFTGRCEDGPHSNREIVDTILARRHERAKLLGYASHADYALTDSMAKTPEAAKALLMQLWAPALRSAAIEQAELQRIAEAGGETFEIAPWDWRFYAERVRVERHALDGGEVKRHLTLTKVRGAAFDCARRLYGLRFEARSDLPVWHPDVDAWSVADGDGTPLGLLYTDYLARSAKHGGAWMGSLRVQEKLDGAVLPIAYLVANFAKAPPGSDTGLSLDEAATLFHEFGHALHALLSDVTYPSQAGTAVARDFVEFPSKFMEHWIFTPETLRTLGVAPALIEAIGHADDFGQGFATVELVASSLLDLAVHSSDDVLPDSREITDRWLAASGMPGTIVPRHGLTHFTHIFDGGYAGAYYSYLWSEVLDADAFSAFTEHGNLFDPELAARFRREILAVGNMRDPAESFLAFRGRSPDTGALLRQRHLTDC